MGLSTARKAHLCGLAVLLLPLLLPLLLAALLPALPPPVQLPP